jgi:hypothetical protein
MFAEEDKGVVFYETVVSLKSQKHTCIEYIPLPWEKFNDIPASSRRSSSHVKQSSRRWR